MLDLRESPLPCLICVGWLGDVPGEGGAEYVSLGREEDCRYMLIRSLLEFVELPRNEPEEFERPGDEFLDCRECCIMKGAEGGSKTKSFMTSENGGMLGTGGTF